MATATKGMCVANLDERRGYQQEPVIGFSGSNNEAAEVGKLSSEDEVSISHVKVEKRSYSILSNTTTIDG